MRKLHVLQSVVMVLFYLVVAGGYVYAANRSSERTPVQATEAFWSAVISKDDNASIDLTDAETDADKERVRTVVAQYRSASDLADVLKERFHASEDDLVRSPAGSDFSWFNSVMKGFQNQPVEQVTGAEAKVTSERPTGNYTIELIKKDDRWLVKASQFPTRPAKVSTAASDYIGKRTKQGWFRSLDEVGDRWFLERDIQKFEGDWHVFSAFGQPLAADAPGARFTFYRDPNCDGNLLCTWADDKGPNAGKPVMGLRGRVVQLSQGVARVDFAGDGRINTFTVVGDWDSLNMQTDDPVIMSATRHPTSTAQAAKVEGSRPRPAEYNVVDEFIKNLKADEPTPYNPGP